MTEERSKLSKLIVACWQDESVLSRLKSDPKSVLAEFDLEVPDPVQVTVVENDSTTMYLTIPTKPNDPSNLSDAELYEAAGGGCCGTIQVGVGGAASN